MPDQEFIVIKILIKQCLPGNVGTGKKKMGFSLRLKKGMTLDYQVHRTIINRREFFVAIRLGKEILSEIFERRHGASSNMCFMVHMGSNSSLLQQKLEEFYGTEDRSPEC
jgi:hypothetical protein